MLRRVGADLALNLDWTALSPTNMGSVPEAQRAQQWSEQAEQLADQLRVPLVI